MKHSVRDMKDLDGKFVFVHPSDELYGADRMLLEMTAAMKSDVPFEVWVPTDQTHAQNTLCEELERRGVTVRHVTLPILRRRYMTLRGLLSLAVRSLKCYRELRHRRAGIVYCTTSAAFLAAPIARLARIPHVVGHIQEIWSRSDKVLLAGLVRSCHAILAISHAAAASLPGSCQRRVCVVPNATTEPERASSLDGRTGPLTFLVASRWNDWKGHATLLKAWDLADCPGRLVILGGKPSNGLGVDVPVLVSHLRRPETVEIVGEVHDTSPYVSQADVVLMPSDEPEPFGLVAIEAFARSRPVVASAAGGLLEVVAEGENGWFFPPKNAEALSTVLRQMTRAKVVTAGRAARKTYEANYTTGRFAAMWWNAVKASVRRDGGRSFSKPLRRAEHPFDWEDEGPTQDVGVRCGEI